MIPDRIPFLAWRPIPYRSDAGKLAAKPNGWVPHVSQSNGSLFAYFAGLSAPNRKFSHGWIAKDGSGEQYTELSNRSWAAAGGNVSWWHFEFEGFATEPMTQAQLATAAKLHRLLGCADALAESPNGSGIGTHYMGGPAWGGHSCPDPQGQEGKGPRSLQRQTIIDMARGVVTGTGGSDMLSDADKQWLYTRDGANNTWIADRIDQVVMPVLNEIAAKVNAVVPGANIDVAAIAKATVDELARRESKA